MKSELVDRYGEAPPEAEHLCEIMSLKGEMRRLKLRALEGGPGRLVATLGQQAALDPVRLAQLVARSKDGLKLTPEMKLVFPLEPGVKEPAAVLEQALRMMRALGGIRA